MLGSLIQQHLAKKHKIMVFCVNIFGLKVFSEALNKPMIHGKTKNTDRAVIISRFRRGTECVSIFVSALTRSV